MAAKRVLIVGGVAGGASCAARLRRLDERAEIVMFERGPDVSFANCGLPYYVGGVIKDRQKLLVATPELFRDWLNVEVRVRHEVQEIDRANRTIEVRNLESGGAATEPYDVLVLAPGAAPIRPPLPGSSKPGIFCVRNLQDVDRIHDWVTRLGARRAVVVGGGYIGLEMVENLSRRGLEVTVLELLDQVMPTMDREMVAPVQAELRSKGVDLQLANPVAAFESASLPSPSGREAGGEGLTVIAQDGRRFPADVVILAVGVKPETGLAKKAGLEIGPTGGIRVDEQMRTSDRAVFAVGDAVEVRDFVTGRPALIPLAGPANRQGRIAADVICGRQSHYRGSQGSCVVGVFDLTLAMTGATEKTLQTAGIPFNKSYTHSLSHAGYYPGAEMMMLKLLYTPEDGRLLGAQAVGKAGVAKRIDVLAFAIQKGATVYDLEEAELCYAPQYGSAKDPVNMTGFVAGNVLRGDVDPVHWTDWKARRESDGEMPLVLDVRNPKEVAKGAVPGTVNIPLPQLRRRLAELPRDREIWVHCGVGQRSYYASRILKQNGFNVRNLSGGMKTYKLQP
ncbi:MAG: FAD-dependent oxidoreductase [Planctomycetota bacterium]|jgi:NADPH-dependent 2,4-dienoyl-CoA reductase/sulfur reductase-like enzyme/rhodanese-related sulfurtransferase